MMVDGGSNNWSSDSTPIEIVSTFYEALARSDGDGVAELVRVAFRTDSYVDFPPSLPYGGRVEGAERLARMFRAAASAKASIGVRNLRLTKLIGDHERVAAVLSFDYLRGDGRPPIPTDAVELWTFDSQTVAGIDVFYRDVASLLAG